MQAREGKWEIQTRLANLELRREGCKERETEGDKEMEERWAETKCETESRLLLKALLAVPGHWVWTISCLYRLFLLFFSYSVLPSMHRLTAKPLILKAASFFPTHFATSI